ncbi:MAG: alginate export family protein [Candidatus Eiseniibacteriota bacterium]
MVRMFSGGVSAVAGMALIAITGAQTLAAEVQWDGDVRIRYEADDRSFAPDVSAEHTVFQRTRLSATAKNDKGAEVMIQLQDSRIWGDEGSTLNDTENVDIHQAVARLQDPNIEGLEWILGRHELYYGAGRVFAVNDWSNVGRSFDAARARMSFDDEQWLDLGFGKVSEEATTSVDENIAFGVWHIQVADPNLSLEPLILYKENDAFDSFMTSLGNHGAFESGRIRVTSDLVYQTGQVAGSDAKAYLANAMLAVDASGALDGSSGIAGGYSIYSGDDPAEGDDAAYDNLYFDDHKYHGLMDIAHNIVDAGGLGLRDVFLKAWVETPQGVMLKGAVHRFTSDIDVTLPAGGGDRNGIGNEFDLVISKDLESGMSAQVGGGVFSPGDLTENLLGDESAFWAYAQGTVGF